jgi:hypothetical protein
MGDKLADEELLGQRTTLQELVILFKTRRWASTWGTTSRGATDQASVTHPCPSTCGDCRHSEADESVEQQTTLPKHGLPPELASRSVAEESRAEQSQGDESQCEPEYAGGLSLQQSQCVDAFSQDE